jgi:ABC-type uncharacterized transport system substrate-binding protein
MKKISIYRLPIIAFFICLSIFLVMVNVSKPRVLILHSYAPDYSWVRDIDSGINSVLGKKSYVVKNHYLDTRQHPDIDYMLKAGLTARNMIKKWQPDVIIAVDDNAQMLVGKYFVNDPATSIVFASVQGVLEEYGYDTATNVTGIFQRIQLEAIKDALLQILPEGHRRIVHLSDASQTAIFSGGDINAYTWAPLELVSSTKCKTFEDWKVAIENSKGTGDILLIADYHSLKRSAADKSIVPSQEVIEWTEGNASIPGMSGWGSYVEDGGMIAVVASPFEQGEVSANMAVDIIENGKKPREIIFQDNQMYVVHLRESRVKAHKVQMPSIIEAFARATNHYYE